MRHLKHHALHLAMCAPMFAVAIIAIAAGANVGALLPAIACLLMMALMMGGMAHAVRGRSGGDDRH